MHDSKRYRAAAADCLLAAETCEPCYRKLHLSMAISWLSLAHSQEVTEDLLASCDIAGPIVADKPVRTAPRARAAPEVNPRPLYPR
jgi:hypothetical protein